MLKTGPVWSLGTMSGTSLDGVDAAMVLTDGDRIIEFGPSTYRAYTLAEQKTLAAAFGKWPGDPGVSDAAEVVETAHAEILSRFDGADLIGFHGQTLAHDPAGGRTHQCGNGALLAEALGLPVVWDFRSGDVAMGGQGAPLVPFFHYACARFIGATSAFAILNLGGVGNITWIDPSKSTPEEPGALLAFDTGPANAPINDLMQVLTGQGVDLNGAFAAPGHVHEPLIDAFLALSYFHKIPPKSLDRNEFAQNLDAICALPDHDAVATLTALAAACVAKGCEHFAQPISRLLVAGGGRHNASLMTALDERLPLVAVAPVSSVGLDGDMLEAQAFAYLAVRVMQGKPTSCPSTTGVAAAVGGGKISRPERV